MMYDSDKIAMEGLNFFALLQSDADPITTARLVHQASGLLEVEASGIRLNPDLVPHHDCFLPLPAERMKSVLFYLDQL